MRSAAIALWLIGALFSFGFCETDKSEPTVMDYSLLFIAVICAWPLILGANLRDAMSPEKEK